MQDIEELIGRLVEISEVKLAGGWRGWVAVREAGRERFSKTEWETLLAEPEKLFEGAQEILKRDDFKVVTVKYLAIGGRGVKAVIKRQQRGGGLRNFIAAVRLRQAGLAVAAPLAAVYRRSLFSHSQSIWRKPRSVPCGTCCAYISEYVDGVGLPEFIRNLPEDLRQRHRVMRRLSEHTAEILAGLHNKKLWHSNLKASDFIVSGNGPEDYRIVLTDMEGIKQYFLRKESRRMQMLRQLAESITAIPTIQRTDYLRVFKLYCEKTEIADEERAAIFMELSRRSQGKSRRV